MKMKTEELVLTNEWDKAFPQSDKVNHKKVAFVNRYGITLAADMYIPKNTEGKLPAIDELDYMLHQIEKVNGGNE